MEFPVTCQRFHAMRQIAIAAVKDEGGINSDGLTVVGHQQLHVT